MLGIIEVSVKFKTSEQSHEFCTFCALTRLVELSGRWPTAARVEASRPQGLVQQVGTIGGSVFSAKDRWKIARSRVVVHILKTIFARA